LRYGDLKVCTLNFVAGWLRLKHHVGGSNKEPSTNFQSAFSNQKSVIPLTLSLMAPPNKSILKLEAILELIIVACNEGAIPVSTIEGNGVAGK